VGWEAAALLPAAAVGELAVAEELDPADAEAPEAGAPSVAQVSPVGVASEVSAVLAAEPVGVLVVTYLPG
jgi:hypothetical protein